MPPARLPVHLLDNARRLRREATDAESLLWGMLRARRFGGFKFRRQVALPPYVVDFYCSEARLVVELDGGQHAEPEHVLADERRSSFLTGRGIRVLRAWNHEVLVETEAVAARLWELLAVGAAGEDGDER
jgi:adenine-specific DNA-methyltransferase